MKKKVSLCFIVWLACMNVSCANEHWGYSGKNGPEYWHTLSPDYAQCARGKNQSPINVTPQFDVNLPPIQFNYLTQATTITNNGHTIQLDFAPGNVIIIGKEQFTLLQVHFHTPSENLEKGKSYPFEAHFVHQAADKTLAVIAVFYQDGIANPVLDQLWKQIPQEKQKTVSLSTGIDISPLVPTSKDYTYFNGSLTTPPCTEGVRWFVLKQHMSISPEQVATFQKVIGKNNRPVCPLNARVVVE